MSEYDFSTRPQLQFGWELDPTKLEFKRGGIIPYLQFKGVTYYALGIDAGYQTLIDFGGHREPEDGDIFTTACRELVEESLGVFGVPSHVECERALVINNRNLVEIFLPLPPGNPDLIQHRFIQRVRHEPDPENSDLVWLTGPELTRVIQSNQPPMYPVLQKLLHDSGVIEILPD
jgi:hypothetical protein